MIITFSFPPLCKEKRTCVNQDDGISVREGDMLKLQCEDHIIKTHRKKVWLPQKETALKKPRRAIAVGGICLGPQAKPTLRCLENAAVAGEMPGRSKTQQK